MGLKIIHSRGGCIGCNACVAIAPQCWMMDESDGKSRLIGGVLKKDVYVGEIFECDKEANERAAEACPVSIIKVV
ncbi:ferredoxin [Candidatus Peregrinibacteria bacterium]|jgi:ferredoxin|nr:ferredoxin [Candidatus Peregrinibacteria bacterium]MBT4631469.1 ferredoxin [Candidatus Peregrinibacteria bacterium]MBT5516498.1 ferredoxin [Candidatus Peregrinibacteria bacterium]MBT5823858.1 ferredoxin [Candidatus Peregrinibacteria bacterium]